MPSWIWDAQARLTDEAARTAILSAIGAALGDYIELVQPAAEDETELELAAHFPGWISGDYGAVSARGDWLPLQPQGLNFNWAHWNWRHTIRGGAPMHRTIANQQLTPARVAATAAVQAARQAQAQDGSQARHEIPAVGVPEGVRAALDGDHAGGDIPMLQHAQPGHDGAAQRPARDRFGNRRSRRKLVYRGVLKKR